MSRITRSKLLSDRVITWLPSRHSLTWYPLPSELRPSPAGCKRHLQRQGCVCSWLNLPAGIRSVKMLPPLHAALVLTLILRHASGERQAEPRTLNATGQRIACEKMFERSSFPFLFERRCHGLEPKWPAFLLQWPNKDDLFPVRAVYFSIEIRLTRVCASASVTDDGIRPVAIDPV